jgi:hypothetical protein
VWGWGSCFFFFVFFFLFVCLFVFVKLGRCQVKRGYKAGNRPYKTDNKNYLKKIIITHPGASAGPNCTLWPERSVLSTEDGLCAKVTDCGLAQVLVVNVTESGVQTRRGTSGGDGL